MSASLTGVVDGVFSTLATSIPGAVRSVSYEAAGAQSYNPTTGALTNTVTTFSAVPAVFLNYSRKEKESDFQNSRRQTVEFGDVKCLIPYNKLPITVGLEDIIVEGTKRWRIVDYSVDPTGTALHTFQLRQS